MEMKMVIERSIYPTTSQNKGSKSRLVKSHDFVMSLTILGPVSHSHELATDFSRFLEKSNSKQFWNCRVVSKLDINR